MGIKFGDKPDETVERADHKTESQHQDFPSPTAAEECAPTKSDHANLNIEQFMSGASSFIETGPDATAGTAAERGEHAGSVQAVMAMTGERPRVKPDVCSVTPSGQTIKIDRDMLMTENSKRLIIQHHSVGAGLIGRPFACASANARAVLGDLAEDLSSSGAAPWLIYRTATGLGCVMGVDAMTDPADVKLHTEDFFAKKIKEPVTVSFIEFAPGEIARLNAVASSTDPIRQALIEQPGGKAVLAAAFERCGVTRATLLTSTENLTAHLERFGGGKDSFSLAVPQPTTLLAACEQMPNFLVLDGTATADTEPFDRVAVDFDQILHAFNRESGGVIARVSGYGYGVTVIAGRNGSGKTTTAISLAERCASGMDGAVAVIGMRANGSSHRWIQITADAAKPDAWKKAAIAPANVIVVKVNSGDELAGAYIQEAASRGKMVIVSMDASSIPEAISSLIASGMDAAFVVNSVHLVATQSLVPVICPDCATKDDRETTNQEVDGFPLWRKLIPENGSILLKKKGHGCPTCKMTGYIGLNPIIEILDVEQADKEVRKNILNGEFVDVLASINIQKRGWAAGMNMVVRGEIDTVDLSRTVRKVVSGK